MIKKSPVSWCGWQYQEKINRPAFLLVNDKNKSTVTFNFNKHILSKKEIKKNIIKIPNYDHDIEYLIEEAETGLVTLSCGCQVELDGTCSHGNKSPLLILSMIK